IVLVLEHLAPRAREAHVVTADGMTLEYEATDSIWLTHPSSLSAGELFLEQLVELRGVRLSARRLHHLSYEVAEQLVLARAVIGELARIFRHDVVDGLFDRPGIGDLLEALRLDDGVRVL